jgi:hypothetical protein
MEVMPLVLTSGSLNPTRTYYSNNDTGVGFSYLFEGLQPPSLKEGPLDGDFRLENVRFYWPGNHLVDGRGCDVEIYSLYYKVSEGKLENAFLKEGGWPSWQFNSK